MDCPHCQSKNTRELTQTTLLNYQQFCCRKCGKQYNERTGTPLNFIEYPTEVVMMVIHYYYRFKVSLDDVVELMMMRKIHLSHQTVHNWVHIFGVELGLKLRAQRQRKVGKKWHSDATYVCIKGHWHYLSLYPAIENVFGESTKDRDFKYLCNVLEQNHRGIKSRYKVMKGFKDSWCAMIFCTVFEEIRQFFRMKDKARCERRKIIVPRINRFNKLMTPIY